MRHLASVTTLDGFARKQGGRMDDLATVLNAHMGWWERLSRREPGGLWEPDHPDICQLTFSSCMPTCVKGAGRVEPETRLGLVCEWRVSLGHTLALSAVSSGAAPAGSISVGVLVAVEQRLLMGW